MSEHGDSHSPSGAKDTDHWPNPGPGYWDWRCLICGEPVRNHSSLFERFMAKWIKR